MITIVAISLLALSGQTQLPAEADKIYKIYMPGDEIRYGAIREMGQQVTVIFDEPWDPKEPKNFAIGRLNYEPEPQVNRESRLKEVGEAAGYLLRETPGGMRWVPKEEYTYFKRAQTMMRRNALPEEPGGMAAAPAKTEVPPGLVAQFWPHAAVIMAGLALLALVLKKMVLRG